MAHRKALPIGLCLLSLICNSLVHAGKVPDQLVVQMVRDDQDVKECFEKMGLTKTAEFLTVEKISLSNKEGEELLVESTHNSDDCILCGNRRCSAWVYKRMGKGYALLLMVGGLDEMKVLPSSTNGLRDLKVVYPAGNFDPATVEIYKFDGKRYREYKTR